MNDKGINDALENGITSCLRSLQRTNPTLLLTAQQLKRVERDAKYVPAVAGAIASVLSRSKQIGLYEDATKIMSGWDKEAKDLGIAPFDQAINPDRIGVQQATSPRSSNRERETYRIEALRPLLERRLRFVVSEEFKDAKREKIRKEREDEAVQRRRHQVMQKRKHKRTARTDEMMNSDCFDSDGSAEEHGVISHSAKSNESIRGDFGSLMSSPEKSNAYERHAHTKSGHSNNSDESGHSLNGIEQRSKAKIPPIIRSPANFDVCHDCMDSDEEESASVTPANNVFKTDGVSSDDDWDEKFGMVVPGSFFH